MDQLITAILKSLIVFIAIALFIIITILSVAIFFFSLLSMAIAFNFLVSHYMISLCVIFFIMTIVFYTHPEM